MRSIGYDTRVTLCIFMLVHPPPPPPDLAPGKLGRLGPLDFFSEPPPDLDLSPPAPPAPALPPAVGGVPVIRALPGVRELNWVAWVGPRPMATFNGIGSPSAFADCNPARTKP